MAYDEVAGVLHTMMPVVSMRTIAEPWKGFGVGRASMDSGSLVDLSTTAFMVSGRSGIVNNEL